MQETTVNYQLPELLPRTQLDIGVSYNTDLERATDILHDITSDLVSVANDREPEVNIVELADSAIVLRILVWQHNPIGARKIQEHIFREALKRFEYTGIDIPYPHMDVLVRNADHE